MSQKLFAFTFPGGWVKKITIAATAGNVVSNKNPGTGKRWVVIYGRVTLVADANAANRYIRLQITDGTNIVYRFPINSTAITAGQTESISYGSTGAGLSAITGDKANIGIDNLIIEDLQELRISIDAGLVGDSFSGYFYVLELRI